MKGWPLQSERAWVLGLAIAGIRVVPVGGRS